MKFADLCSDPPRELLRKSNDHPELMLQFGLVQFGPRQTLRREAV
jgi:hypothetical protein